MPEEEDLSRELNTLAEELQKHVEVKDRKYHLKTYKSCFVGKDAVDYMVSAGHAKTRDDAVALGKALQNSPCYLFEHVTRDHEFADDNLFFRFLDEKERGTFGVDDKSGKKIDWSNFLMMNSEEGNSCLQPTFPETDLEALNSNDVHVASKMWPMDSYNTALLNHVHPPNWQDPVNNEGKNHYDLVVIGAGAGGLISSLFGVGSGAKTALIEEHMMGGDCLNVGCVPSKALIHSATLAHQCRLDRERMEEAGIILDPKDVKIDFAKVMERVRKVRAEISHHDSAERYTREFGVEVYIGRGKFTSEQSVEVNGQTLYFKRAVIATGGYPALVPIPGLKELYEKSTIATPAEERPVIMTNETFFNLTKQPKRMVVIGSGVIGMELAQSMQRLGTSVTLLGRSGRVLQKEDQDMAKIVQERLTKDGVTFLLSVTSYEKIELTGRILDENGYPEMKLSITEKNSGPQELICDAILIAAGRRPNVTGLDLELAKVEYDTRKGLNVDDTLRTTNPRIFGVGDCATKFQFTHAADAMAGLAVQNAFFPGNRQMSKLLIPYATFTHPEIASVGLYGPDLDEMGIPYRTFEKPFKENDRSICDDATEGFVRFRVDAKTDKILGCSIVGEGAGNMISEITVAMHSGTGLGALASVIHPYPTNAEVFKGAGGLYKKTKLTNTVKKLLRGIVKLQR